MLNQTFFYTQSNFFITSQTEPALEIDFTGYKLQFCSLGESERK